MRGLMILCLISVALAAPQYNYQQPAQAAPAAHHHEAPAASAGPGVAAPAPGYSQAPAAQGIVNKQFYIHSAPEDSVSEGANLNQDSSQVSKSLRVVIIKAPENKGLESAALQLAKSASDSQTAIYILNKQTDTSELQQKLSQIQGTNANKPEVHFVKYRTPEEAQYAQQAIQSQYNSLPGPSQVSDEGVAPVENFGGSVGGGSVGGGSIGGGSGFGGQGGYDSGPAAGGSFGSVSNAYLPSAKRL